MGKANHWNSSLHACKETDGKSTLVFALEVLAEKLIDTSHYVGAKNLDDETEPSNAIDHEKPSCENGSHYEGVCKAATIG